MISEVGAGAIRALIGVLVYFFGVAAGYFVLGGKARRDRDAWKAATARGVEDGERRDREIEELRAEVRRLGGVVADREDEIVKAGDQLDETQRKLERANKWLDEQIAAKSSLERTNADLGRENQVLRDRNLELTGDLGKKDRKIQDLTGETVALSRECDSLKREVQKYHTRYGEQLREIDELNKRLMNYPDRLNGLAQARDDAKSCLDDLKNQLALEKQLCKSEHTKRVEAMREVTRLGTEIHKLNGSLCGLKRERDHLEGDLNKALGQVGPLRLENARLGKRLAAFGRRHNQARERFREKLSEVEAERDRLGESLRKSTDVRAERDRANRQVEALSKSLHDCTGKFATVSNENRVMFGDNARLVGERDQLRTDLDEARERLAIMGETNGKLVEERDKLNSEIKSLRLGVAPGIEEMRKLREENGKLRAENDRLREVSRDSQARLIQFKDETVDRLRASNERLSKEQAETLGRARKAERERDEALEALESVRARVEDVLHPPADELIPEDDDEERDDDE
jgi:chromosome segregation ATPase